MGTRFQFAVTSSMVTSGMAPSILPMWNPLDPVNSFLQDAAEALREWYTSFLETIVTLLTTVAVPTPEMLQSDFFSLAIGGTYGLARIAVALVATVVAITVVVSPTLRHGMKIQRAFTSMVLVVLFGWLFFPLYGMLYNVSKGFTEGILALLSGTDSKSAIDAVIALFPVANATDAINTIIAMGISGFLGIFIVIEAVGIFVLSFIVMLLYPLGIAFRALGEFGNKFFNALNAAAVTTLVSPPIMALAYLLPAFVQKDWSAIAIVASPFFAIVGSFIAMIVPLVVFHFSYKRSSEVFGRIDDASGKFDIGQIPPVSIEEVKSDVQVTNNNATSAVVADVIGDSLLYGKDKGDLFDDIVKTAVNVTASAATAAGHPYVGMAAKGLGGMYQNSRSKPDAPNNDTQ